MCLPITIWQIDVGLVPLYRLGRASGNATGLATGGLRHRSKKRLSQSSGAKLSAAIHLLELDCYKTYVYTLLSGASRLLPQVCNSTSVLFCFLALVSQVYCLDARAPMMPFLLVMLVFSVLPNTSVLVCPLQGK